MGKNRELGVKKKARVRANGPALFCKAGDEIIHCK